MLSQRRYRGLHCEYRNLMDVEQVTFTYSIEKVVALEITLSGPRLAKYVEGATGDKAAALQRYVFNTTVSEAFYTPLQGLEICLRNSLSTHLPRVCGTDWFKENACSLFNYPVPEMLRQAAGKLVEERKSITDANIIAELNLGFWITILGPKYETDIWRPGLRLAFPHRPRGIERKQIQGALNSIRRLRNRVAHHEPILDRKLSLDHSLIIGLISWMCPDTAAWVEAHSRVPAVLDSANWKDPTAR